MPLVYYTGRPVEAAPLYGLLTPSRQTISGLRPLAKAILGRRKTSITSSVQSSSMYLRVRYVYKYININIDCPFATYMPIMYSLPGLHITLGVFYRLWSLLEQACHQLDLELAKHTAPLSADRQSFSEYAKVVRDLAIKPRRREK